MATVGNNTSAKHEHLRESFFTDEERKYFEMIMKDPAERVIHATMLKQNANTLYTKAMELIEMVEGGMIGENEMAEVEYLIAHCLAAIEDVHQELSLENMHEM